MEKKKYTDEKTNEEVTRLNFEETETGRKNIYTDIKEFEDLRKHLKPLGVTPSKFITNIIKTTNQAIRDSKPGEDVRVSFGIEFPKNKNKSSKEDNQ